MLQRYDISQHPKFTATLIFFFGLLLFTGGLFNHEFIEFESRFGLFAQEMLRNGITLFPTTYHQYYPDYPATQTILTYLFSLPFHKVTIFTAVLPTAIASSLTLSFIYLIGTKIDYRLGIAGILFALFTFNFLAAARSISLDQFVTTATVASFYCIYQTSNSNLNLQKKTANWLPLIWFLGFAFRGPIGLIIPASIVGGYFLLERNYKACVITAITALLLLLICITTLLGMAWHEGGQQFVQHVINMQVMSRLNEGDKPPFYYYFIDSFSGYAMTFPIAIVIFLSYLKTFLNKPVSQTLSLLRHLAFGTLIILVGMSIPGSKKIRYILPIVPFVSLASAILFIEQLQTKFQINLKNFIVLFCKYLPLVSLVLVAVISILNWLKQITLDIHYLMLIILLSILACVSLRISKKILIDKDLSILGIGATTFIVLYIFLVQPTQIQLNQVKPFVLQVEMLRQPGQNIVFYQIGPDGADIKFMVALDKPIQPDFLEQPQELVNYTKPGVFIFRKESFIALPKNIQNQFTVLMMDKLGHLPCIVAIKNNPHRNGTI